MRGNGELPLEEASLEAKPPLQIGLILHRCLCRAPSLEVTLIASFTLSHPSKGLVIKLVVGKENKILHHTLKNICDRKLSNDSYKDSNKAQVQGNI